MAKFIIRITLSCLLLLYLFLKTDWQLLAGAFETIHFGFYFASTIIAISGVYVIATKYYFLIRNTLLSLSLTRLLVIQFICEFYALFLPMSAVSRAAVRWYKVTKNKTGRSFFVTATVLERLLFLLLLLVCGSLPLLLTRHHPGIILLADHLLPLTIGAAILTTTGIWYLFSSRLQAAIRKAIPHIPFLQAPEKAIRLLKSLSLQNPSPSLLGPLFLLTLLWQGVHIARVYFLFAAMELPLGVIDAVWMGSLVLLLQVLPISFAGLGLREGAYAYLFVLYGLPAEKGLVVGLLFFSQMLVFATVGAILTFCDLYQQNTNP